MEPPARLRKIACSRYPVREHKGGAGVASDSQRKALEREIVGLFDNIQRIKRELASVKHPKADEDMLGSVADQLAAIADETTKAANEIMSATEAIDAVNQELMKQVKFGGARDYFVKIDKGIERIFEACSFHDITGQRLSRIVRTINRIEGTLNSLVVIVGKDSIAALPVETTTLSKMDGDIELAGPQLAERGMSQNDIDKLFD
jgi:chemotaxis regulatin CheY-phosphate phosphatase CheZ